MVEKRAACVRVSYFKAIHDCVKNKSVAASQSAAVIQKSSGQNRGVVHVRGKMHKQTLEHKRKKGLEGASHKVVLEMMLGSECSGKEE
ncbi:hypothetical protein PBY51_011409 [Eleginops maclovinus]|uniref:Uncharacterized protein n=1 Tax=Eleginops maclovinus TaxID=56733 RepID=A0AAN7XRB3_ELEMC|nr:hypothetical protein PBY51_011409 [Eleginops maclovinus]